MSDEIVSKALLDHVFVVLARRTGEGKGMEVDDADVDGQRRVDVVVLGDEQCYEFGL